MLLEDCSFFSIPCEDREDKGCEDSIPDNEEGVPGPSLAVGGVGEMEDTCDHLGFLAGDSEKRSSSDDIIQRDL